jgi:nitronate monooxygenase
VSVLRTPLCDLLGIELPILQAGMGRARGSPTTPALVAAVSEAGGLGCLGATGMEHGRIRAGRNEITEAWRASGLDPLPMPHQQC